MTIHINLPKVYIWGVVIKIASSQIAFIISHLTQVSDLVAVEVVGLLSAFAVFGCSVVDLRQGVVAVGIGVDIGIPAVRVDFLQQMAAVPNKSGFLFEAVPA